MKAETEQRLALIVGAGNGIGAATARRLARDGLRLALADRDDAALARLKEELGAEAFTVDIADAEAVTCLFDAVEDRCGAVNVLVNTAAISPMAEDGGLLTIAKTGIDLMRQVIEINTLGTMYLGREFALRAERAGPQGRVVLLSSTAAQLGGHKSAVAYIASKGAVLSFGKGLARELAPFGVTVNCVAPGLIDTPMLRGAVRPDQDAEAARAVPLGRIGGAGEVADAIAYLVSPNAAYVTGTTLDVNGGYHMR